MISRKEAELLEKSIKKIQSMENIAGLPMYDLSAAQEFKASIRVDNSVPHGLFKPNPAVQNRWICSEQTFRAMKKNIFALDEEMLDLADNHSCDSCRNVFDRQFWHFCPYCGTGFKSKL